MRPKSIVLAVLVAIFLAGSVEARTKVQFDVTDASTNALSSLLGTGVKVLKACPGASVTVYLQGTLTKATLYSNASGTSKSNPFTAVTLSGVPTSRVEFHIDDGTYDFSFTGGGCTSHSWTGVIIGNGGVSLSVLGFGAICNNSNDDTTAINTALAFSGPHSVSFPAGTCRVTTTLAINQDRVNLIGAGQQVSKINCDLTVTGTPCIHFNGGDSGVGVGHVLDQSSIRGLTLFTDSDAGIQKIGVRLTDVSSFILSDFATYPFSSNGNSIALQVRGREFISTDHLNLSADQPVSIEDNPDATIDIDLSRFDGMELHCTTASPCIKIASGVNWTRTRIRDFICIGGSYCIDRNDTATSQYGEMAIIGPGSWEQPTTPPAEYTVRWVSNFGFRGLYIQNILSGTAAQMKGYYFRKVEDVTISGSSFLGSAAEALNIDGTVKALALINTEFIQSSSISTTGARMVFRALPKLGTLDPTGRVEFWESASNSEVTSGKMVKIGDLHKYAYTVTVTAGLVNRVEIPMSGGGQTAGKVDVFCRGATLTEGGSVVFSTNSNQEIGGTANFGVGNTAGEITVWVENASTLSLTNQTAEDLTCGVSYEWF